LSAGNCSPDPQSEKITARLIVSKREAAGCIVPPFGVEKSIFGDFRLP